MYNGHKSKKKDKKSFHIIIWLLSGLRHIWLFSPLVLLCTIAISSCKVTKNRRYRVSFLLIKSYVKCYLVLSFFRSPAAALIILELVDLEHSDIFG